MEEEGIFYFCRSTTNFVNTTLDDESASAAIAIVEAGNRHGIIILDNDGETEVVRVRSDDIQVGSDQHAETHGPHLGCSQPATTQSILIALLLPLRGHGQTFGQQTVEVENDETHWVGHDRSVRVRDAGSRPGTVMRPASSPS